MDAISSAFQLFIFPGFLFLMLLSFLFEWIDRKLYAGMQRRMGPLYTGPSGLLQPIADFIKLMKKEDLTPKYSDKKIFNSVPLLMCSLMLVVMLILPVAGESGVVSFTGDVIFAIAAMTLFCILIFLAGFSSMSPYPLLGAERAVLLLLGFEIPLMLSIAGCCIASGSIEVSSIVSWQASHGWNILGPQLLGFAIFLVAIQAELERVPFDIPDAEQEIVAGWMTEYSGRKLALIRMARNLELVFMSALAATLYLGGPLGAAPEWAEGVAFPVYFLLKTVAILLILTIIRGIFARVRIDQMVAFAWRYLIPLSFLQVAMTLIWRLI